jgi:hypothetical protein
MADEKKKPELPSPGEMFVIVDKDASGLANIKKK